MNAKSLFLVFLFGALFVLSVFPSSSRSEAQDDDTAANSGDLPKVDAKIVSDTTTQTDDQVASREGQAIKLDGLSAEESQQLRDQAEKHQFQSDVSRMMKLIINSLYKNKEIFLRELISNASDALDKIRFFSLTDKNVLGTTTDLSIKIHADKENKVLHITDTGVGMTKKDLINNLGTIAKSGTSEFLQAMQQTGGADTSNLIGQFGVGFYSAFLVADTVVVTSKHNDDKQHIWESDSEKFSISEDPRDDNQLGRGTRVSLYLKEEAQDYLETDKLRDLIKKYSEFINFDIYLYTSKTIKVDAEPEADEEEEEKADDKSADEEEVKIEDDEEEKKEEEEVEKKQVDKTVWEWEIINANKPIWTRANKDVTEEEYAKFYKAFTKDSKDPIEYIHFTAEGEVAFRSILYIPSEASPSFFSEYGKAHNNIKMYVRRVFITDEFDDMLPKYLSFIKGVVDSDDLPLNVSRETLQQHKLLKVIKRKLVRKVLEMLKKMDKEDYLKFWKQFGTAVKLGITEDYSNRSRISKLLMFHSSHSTEYTSLESYVERMKKDQPTIYFVAGQSRSEVENSPFVERLLKRGYEVLYLIEPVDEYTIQNLPEFDGKKFQNVAKDGLKLGDEGDKVKAEREAFEKDFEPLTTWLVDNLGESIEKAVISLRLSESPCALIANQYGWDGNMERIMKAQAYAKHDDSNTEHYTSQKKILEINPRHPLIKKLLATIQVEEEATSKTTIDLANVLLDTARLRSGYSLNDSVAFAARIEKMLRLSTGVSLDEKVDEEIIEEAPAAESKSEDSTTDDDDSASSNKEKDADHDEF